MIKKLFVAAVAAFMMTASASNAATLSLLNYVENSATDGYTTALVSRHDVLPGVNGKNITIIKGSNKNRTVDNGLYLTAADGPVSITYSFLGAEAGNHNYAAILGNNEFFNRGNDATTEGSQVTVAQSGSGLLEFAFGTLWPNDRVSLFSNIGSLLWPTSSYAMGFIQINTTAFYVLFDDIAFGDRDFDDMVMKIEVSAVPLPAGGLLLLTALGGVLVLRRRKAFA